MTETPPTLTTPDGPRPGDVVELVDPASRRSFGATVAARDGDVCTLRLRVPTTLRGRMRIRWFDGDDAWYSEASVLPQRSADHVDVELVDQWEAVPARQSMRFPVDRFPLLVEIVQSPQHTAGRRFDLVCRDISATGCLATTPGRGPANGDLVRVAWMRGDEWTRVQPEWVPGKVTRVDARPFGGAEIGFQFELEEHGDVKRVRAWRDAWAQASLA